MSATTGIEWTDATWNPVRGCSRVSPGCQNCYAERVAARFAGPQRKDGEVTDTPGPFAGFATQSPPRWTGKVALVEDHLLDPLRWRKPRRIFVNSMSDLFHESLPDEAIDRVFAVMALAPRHTFQILTKRAERMRSYLSAFGVAEHLRSMAFHMAREECVLGVMVARDSVALEAIASSKWPLPNVWLGVSCEDQARADERIPLLLQTPAAVRFVSAEPLLGMVNLTPWLGRRIQRVPWSGAAPAKWAEVQWPEWVPEKVRAEIMHFWSEAWQRGPRAYQESAEGPYNNSPPFGSRQRLRVDTYSGEWHEGRWVHAWNNMGRLIKDDGSVVYPPSNDYREERQRRLDWVIVGGESGPGARPCDLAWIRDIVGQCREAGVACFVKQLGARPMSFDRDEDTVCRDRKGGNPAEWAEDLRVREFPR